VELARGTVTDRPWALTLGQMARRGVTGQITITSDNKHYAIAFDRGSIVAARSPMTADSTARVALTSHLISTTNVNELLRRISANPSADEIDLVGELTKIAQPQLDRLRSDVITRMAARTFALERGDFVITDDFTLPTRACTVDFRAVVYHGIRMHVSDTRLSNELRALGGNQFKLVQAIDLHKFGFCDGEWPLLAALREGISIPELEARHRDLDPRTMLAAIYALVACGAVQVTGTTAPAPAVARTPTIRAPQPAVSRAPTPPALPPPPTVPRHAQRARSTAAPDFQSPLARGTVDRIPPPEPKTNPELAAEIVDRASRALASDKPEAAVMDLKKAIELVPNNVDYNALLGWALFCAADDKIAVAAESRKLLEKAVYKSQQPEVARFYLGRVERILGRDKEALRHFHAVLDVHPNHRDASAEVRVLEARLKRLGN